MRMRVDGLLIAPTLQLLRIVHIPSILEASCARVRGNTQTHLASVTRNDSGARDRIRGGGF